VDCAARSQQGGSKKIKIKERRKRKEKDKE
jgi:hypothetical protein